MIRLATAADVAAVQDIVRAAYVKYVDRIGKPPGPMLDDYAARVRDGVVHLLEEGGTPAGIIVLLPKPDHLLLDNIAVAPERQGRGVGRRLLDFADREALRLGYDELRLYTHALMHENLAIYPKLGWEEHRRGEEGGYDRVFFRKRLARRADGNG